MNALRHGALLLNFEVAGEAYCMLKANSSSTMGRFVAAFQSLTAIYTLPRQGRGHDGVAISFPLNAKPEPEIEFIHPMSCSVCRARGYI
ncbi:hypothetical protein DOTSEDRAFT_75951 [Dothistroma septosporum NZE10]|uniref:Uncharacterized protein n=1 Tax=Dothistroma septosporum (strain NZE10 / CBS 128990) TaxID=675120 RepID=N1PCL3_DOTSN|nr:hypothetical protein DOTSEDRAFT_75951 [Dothistroma septosporum NZE10]